MTKELSEWRKELKEGSKVWYILKEYTIESFDTRFKDAINFVGFVGGLATRNNVFPTKKQSIDSEISIHQSIIDSEQTQIEELRKERGDL